MTTAIDIQAEINKQDFSKIVGQMERARKELNMTLKQSVQMARYYIASSLAGSTRVAPKMREVVENPDPRAKTDGRVAKFGVMKFDRNGKQYFSPIYKTGEFGKYVFQDKKTMTWLVRDKATGAVTKATQSTGTGQFDVAGIMQDKRRIIGRRGLAKKAWSWGQSRNGSGSIMGVEAIDVNWTGGEENPTVTLHNKLRYAGDAFKMDGEQAVDSVMQRAFRRMEVVIGQKIDKKKGLA